MAYRCQGCRVYRRDEPYRRVGLGGVCSPECATATRSRFRRSRKPDTGIPPATRTAVLTRDGGCRYCGVHVGLHVHHINYRSEGVDHSETNLIALCTRHHALVHSDKAYWKPVLQSYITSLYETGRKHYLRDVARQLIREHE